MIRSMYPFWSAVIAALLAQCLKPVIYFGLHRKWKLSLIKDSGGFPSSHSALVTALSLSVGLQERFSSTLCAVALALAVIVQGVTHIRRVKHDSFTASLSVEKVKIRLNHADHKTVDFYFSMPLIHKHKSFHSKIHLKMTHPPPKNLSDDGRG